MTYKLPDLPYAYDALEPYIDEETMKLHHDKHHNAYVEKTNKALEGHDDLQNLSIEELVTKLDEVPEDIRTTVRNNGGGHVNHSLFWEVLSPNGGGEPTGELADAINESFGSFDDFKSELETAATGQFGSGWAWLVADKDGKLSIVATPNQDVPLKLEVTPIIAIDVWEHSYYLKYQNRRADFIQNWFNVVDWEKAEENFKKATK